MSKPEVMLEVLEHAAEQLGIKVSYEPLLTTGVSIGMRGGLCKMKGPDGMVWRCIIDKRATAEERLTTLAAAVARFDTSELDLPPKVRELLRLNETSAKHRSVTSAA